MKNAKELIKKLHKGAGNFDRTPWADAIHNGLLAILEHLAPKPRVKEEGVFEQGDPVWVKHFDDEKAHKGTFVKFNPDINFRFHFKCIRHDTKEVEHFASCQHRELGEKKPKSVIIKIDFEEESFEESLIDELTQEEFHAKTDENWVKNAQRTLNAFNNLFPDKQTEIGEFEYNLMPSEKKIAFKEGDDIIISGLIRYRKPKEDKTKDEPEFKEGDEVEISVDGEWCRGEIISISKGQIAACPYLIRNNDGGGETFYGKAGIRHYKPMTQDPS